MADKLVLSGIQPSGAFHLGNYFGAVRQFLSLVDQGYRCFFFLANYHALTSSRDRAQTLSLTREAAVSYLALGLDPEKATLYLQSDVPEVCELAWILSTVTPMGLLERCHAYKDKVARGLPSDHGLFAYPVLQAADILIVRADLVPVGQDQRQHIEVTRDVAEKFNLAYGDLLTLPEPYIPAEVATVPGIDGAKMSKSYGNTIDLFAPEAEVKKRVMGIVTDSKTVAEPKDPATCNVFNIFKLFLAPGERAEWEERYRAGGLGYGEVKKALLARFLDVFGPARRRYQELLGRPEEVDAVFAAGAKRARAITAPLMSRVRDAVGLPPLA